MISGKRWKDGANEPTCEELDDYHDDNIDEFEEEVDKALEKIGESGYDIATVHTSAGNEIF